MIDTKTFEPMENRWQDIFKFLQSAGYKVYSPGTKLGECTFEYIVVKFDGSTKLAGYSTNDDLYQLLCFVPKQRYSTFDSFVQRVRNSMRALEPMIMPYDFGISNYYDDEIKAYYATLGYKNHKKIRR